MWSFPKLSLMWPIILFLLRVRNDSRLLLTKLCLYSKGEYKGFGFLLLLLLLLVVVVVFFFFKTNSPKPSCLNPPVFEVSLSQKAFLSSSGLGKHNLMIGFWDPFLSFIPISYTRMLLIKPNQLPGSALLQKRMEIRGNGGDTSLPCRILEITNRQHSITHVCKWGRWRCPFIDDAKERTAL